jgi:MYXO-CTERM domain-containing protein
MQTAIYKIAVLGSVFCAMTQAATVFNFDNDTVGTSTAFTDTVGGISATFTSPNVPGAFSVQQSFFETLTGNVLGSPGPAFQNDVPLSITFSSDLSAISLVFATADFNTPSPLTLAAYEGTTLVGSNTLAGMFLPGFTFPEGEIAFSGANFNSIVLSTPAPNFAIDQVVVAAAAATPEPYSDWLLGLGLVAVGVPALRRRRN